MKALKRDLLVVSQLAESDQPLSSESKEFMIVTVSKAAKALDTLFCSDEQKQEIE
ncbi:hypothetical protein AB4306_18240 [Vibrio splendidus]|uniref:hypothetical protein n=1 Tax=Vibrio splendidus TaxID=29497 RepID=UPI000A7CE138|nr:hypothetical protein [Vibrio splendidus]PHX05520.1 hypothetical protein VSPL_29140 [Vibrio splendidus]